MRGAHIKTKYLPDSVGYPALVSVAAINTKTKSNLGEEKVYFLLELTGHLERKSRQEPGGTHRSRDREGLLLTCFLSKVCSGSYTTQDHQHRGGTAHSGWHQAWSVINQEYAPKTDLQAILRKEILQLTLFAYL